MLPAKVAKERRLGDIVVHEAYEADLNDMDMEGITITRDGEGMDVAHSTAQVTRGEREASTSVAMSLGDAGAVATGRDLACTQR